MNLLPEMRQLLLLDEWRHPDLHNNELPSQLDAFQRFAHVLATPPWRSCQQRPMPGKGAKVGPRMRCCSLGPIYVTVELRVFRYRKPGPDAMAATATLYYERLLPSPIDDFESFSSISGWSGTTRTSAAAWSAIGRK